MGTDIQLHVEVKINNEWYHYNKPRINRNYDLFAKMADVRNTGFVDPVAKVKGLPEDVTFITKFDHDRFGTDAYCASWLSSIEIALIEKWYNINYGDLNFNFKNFDYLFDNAFGTFFSNQNTFPKGLETFRFVFWFEN